MKIGVPKEIAPNERRVALTPEVAGRLVKGGYEVFIERGAGSAAFFPDAAYTKAGVGVGDRGLVLGHSDIILQVQAPNPESLTQIPEGSALVAFFQPVSEFVRALAQRKLTAFSLVLLPRITRAQPMDVLSSQATVAGYKAVLLAATATGRRRLCEGIVGGDAPQGARTPGQCRQGCRHRDLDRGDPWQESAGPDHDRRRAGHEAGSGDRRPGGRDGWQL